MIVERWWITQKSYLPFSVWSVFRQLLKLSYTFRANKLCIFTKASHTSSNNANQFQNIFIRYFTSVIFIGLKEVFLIFFNIYHSCDYKNIQIFQFFNKHNINKKNANWQKVVNNCSWIFYYILYIFIFQFIVLQRENNQIFSW